MDEKPTPFYQHVVKDVLQVSDNSLSPANSALLNALHPIASRMNTADDLFSLKMAMHLASSLMVKHSTHLGEALAECEKCESSNTKDRTRLLTVATLHYILDYAERTDPTGKTGQDARTIRARLEEMNWLVGEEAMQQLGFSGSGKHVSALQDRTSDTRGREV